MRVIEISLFSGVGMFSIGFQRVNPDHQVGCFVECEAFPQRVLRHHWPDVPIYDDVSDVTYDRLKADEIIATGTDARWLISGGFPCQDLSVAGKQSGIDGDRSGLWGEFARIIGELRHLSPVVFIENVSALLTGESGAWGRRVLGDLAALGFDAEWHVVPAGNAEGRLSAGAPHRRDRVWIVAYPSRQQRNGVHDNTGDMPRPETVPESGNGSGQSNVAHPERQRQSRQGQPVNTSNQAQSGEGQANQSVDVGEPRIGRTVSHMDLLAYGAAARLAGHRWLPEPGVGRVTTGVPDRAAKLKALGNGLVWQIPAAFYAAWLEKT